MMKGLFSIFRWGKREGAGGKGHSLVGADVPAARPEVGPYLAFNLIGRTQEDIEASRKGQGAGGKGHSLVGADVPVARPEVGPYLANVFMQKEVRLSRFQSESYAGGHSC